MYIKYKKVFNRDYFIYKTIISYYLYFIFLNFAKKELIIFFNIYFFNKNFKFKINKEI